MGSLILCHKKRARQPFEIVRVHRKIYTIEELCYYLWNNIYLIDYTIMNEQLCAWIETELELEQLAEELRDSLYNHNSIEHFVMLIFRKSAIYTNFELNQIQSMLEHLKNLKDVERQKYKADNLMSCQAVEAAILVYRGILRREKDETVDGRFYGKVYACLGSAYGRLFLYKEASEMYEAAYQICEDEKMLKAYLYTCYRYMSKEEYQILLSKSDIYRRLDIDMQQKIAKAEASTKVYQSGNIIEGWREQYRKGYI